MARLSFEEEDFENAKEYLDRYHLVSATQRQPVCGLIFAAVLEIDSECQCRRTGTAAWPPISRNPQNTRPGRRCSSMDVAEDNANNPARPAKDRSRRAPAIGARIKERPDGRRRRRPHAFEHQLFSRRSKKTISTKLLPPFSSRATCVPTPALYALSEDEMIEQYLDMYSEEDPPISSTSNMVPELSVKDARIKWTTYLVVLVLGGAVGGLVVEQAAK